MVRDEHPEYSATLVSGDITRTEVCRICRVDKEQIDAMIAEGVIEVLDAEQGEPRFSGRMLWRVRVAARLQRDLEVNLAGAALALDLLEEIERLRQQLARY